MYMSEVGYHKLMLSLLVKRMFPAIPLAIGGDRAKRNQPIIDHQDNIGPLRPDDIPCAMMKLLGVCRRQTRPMLEGTSHENRHFPGESFQGLQRFGNVLGLLLGEALSCRDGNVAMGWQHLTEQGLVPS
jgi:hypothetical protein